MLRRLLACLALLTGLTATGVPAHAQIVAGVASQVEVSETRSTASVRPAAAALRAPADITRPEDCQPARPTPAWIVPLAAAVRIGIDRARE